jgi:DNA-binding response OmpR family regulator
MINENWHQEQQQTFPSSAKIQKQKTKTPSSATILIIDDEFDTTLTFKSALKHYGFKVDVYNDPLLALSDFKPNFYDLLLIDINMPDMNGFELCERLLKIDANPKICFMSSGQINQEALREVHPSINIGCFINKPVAIDYLIARLNAELN